MKTANEPITIPRPLLEKGHVPPIVQNPDQTVELVNAINKMVCEKTIPSFIHPQLEVTFEKEKQVSSASLMLVLFKRIQTTEDVVDGLTRIRHALPSEHIQVAFDFRTVKFNVTSFDIVTLKDLENDLKDLLSVEQKLRPEFQGHIPKAERERMSSGIVDIETRILFNRDKK